MNLSGMRRARPTLREYALDGGLLILRVAVGATMLFAHGLPKLLAYGEKSETFPDPLGVGSSFSLALVVFAEAFCAAAILLGLATRVAAVPLCISMLVVFFVVHGADPFSKRELALMYAAPCLVLILTGAGRFSLDRILHRGRSRASLKLDV